MNIVFLDRDGTVIVDPPDRRVDSEEKIAFFDDSIEALQLFKQHNVGVILITNQAGIEEGLMAEDDFWRIHEIVLQRLAAQGIEIIETYMNGEMDKPDATQWRKPGPKMLLQAAEDHGLNIGSVYMVGDNQSDVQAGINAGCKGGILVERGLRQSCRLMLYLLPKTYLKSLSLLLPEHSIGS